MVSGSGIIDYKGDDRFELSPEIAVFLADSSSPKLAVGIFSDLPQRMAVVERLPQAFSTGIGLDYDAVVLTAHVASSGFSAIWYRFTLVSQVLPKLEGVVSKLPAGAKAANIWLPARGSFNRILMNCARTWPLRRPGARGCSARHLRVGLAHQFVC